MESTENRLVLLEQSVFGKDGPELRFDKIEREQEETRINQATHYKFHQDKAKELDAKLQDEMFTISQQVLKLEGYGKDIENLFQKDQKC